MSSYNNFTPNVAIANVDNWTELITSGVDMAQLGLTDQAKQEIMVRLFHNAHNTTSATLKNYVDGQSVPMAAHMNEAFTHLELRADESWNEIQDLKAQLRDLRTLIEAQNELLKAQKVQLDQIPADAGQAIGGRTKMPEPPLFSGSDNKMTLEDWLNQVALYLSSTGVVTDKQKIILALSRLRQPATTYMKKYYDDNREGRDLGTWKRFEKELTSIYGRRDDKEGAKQEITALWNNKSLANKDFIKFSEQYRTLARIVEYEDQLHIDKLKGIIPDDLRKATVLLDMSNMLPTKWEEYLEILLKAYKALYPEKSKGKIFGTNNGNGTADPNAMEIDAAKKNKGKEVNSQEKKARHCTICAGKGNKQKAKTHNTADCYDKPGNEGKRPAPKTSTSSPSTSHAQGTKGGQHPQGKPSWKNRLIEMIGQLADDDDDTVTPAGTVNVNTASIRELDDSEPAEQGAPADVNELQSEPSRPTGRKVSKRLRQVQLDFPEGL